MTTAPTRTAHTRVDRTAPSTGAKPDASSSSSAQAPPTAPSHFSPPPPSPSRTSRTSRRSRPPSVSLWICSGPSASPDLSARPGQVMRDQLVRQRAAAVRCSGPSSQPACQRPARSSSLGCNCWRACVRSSDRAHRFTANVCLVNNPIGKQLRC